MNEKMLALDGVLEDFYQKKGLAPELQKAILYSIHAGGKRIRPLLFLALLEGFGQELDQDAFKVGAALEMVHTASLIHDDLPAMDNDDYRRGRLTNHKVFGEALAILAGDSLFLDPFALLMETGYPDSVKVALAQGLSQASGTYGMVAGQALDMASEGQDIPLETLEALHAHKTGKLLTFPFEACALVLSLDDKEGQALVQAGEALGLAFQIRDDILDVTADFETIGKTPNKDIAEQKATYPSLLGLEQSRKLLDNCLDQVLSLQADFSARRPFKAPQFVEMVERLRLDA
ncbi:polyprenyl synthetase family protein [Streptococcus sp. DD12]|uniref:polyprenyl synthetase family protein n=1 Tax=Streptococcus sp. DD12 TaxID=1777880 RepID=UPI0008361FC7|nr:farnesyl diphosphate synthase [Streptococcus sp. DD12]